MVHSDWSNCRSKWNDSIYISKYLSKEVWRPNFRQYGHMEKHSQEEAEPGRNSDLERVRREKIRDGESQKREVREKVGKLRNTVFFPCFVAPEGRKVGSLKRRVRSQLAK